MSQENVELERRLREAGAAFIEAHDRAALAIHQASNAGMNADAIARMSGLSPRPWASSCEQARSRRCRRTWTLCARSTTNGNVGITLQASRLIVRSNGFASTDPNKHLARREVHQRAPAGLHGRMGQP